MTIATHDWLIPGLTARLIELHGLTGNAALTMGQIAQRLNAEFHTEITRNAIIGRCRRLGVPPRPSPLPVRGISKIPVEAPIEPIEAPRCEDLGVSIFQLRDGDCKWVLDPVESCPPYVFCGKEAELGTSWCFEHYNKAHVQTRMKWE